MQFIQDMEWMTTNNQDENMEVDIGYIEQMELRITASSQRYDESDDKSNIYVEQNDTNNVFMSDIIWTDEINEYQVKRQLERKLYPFKEVSVLNGYLVFYCIITTIVALMSFISVFFLQFDIDSQR